MRRYFGVNFDYEKFIAHFEWFIAHYDAFIVQSEVLSLKHVSNASLHIEIDKVPKLPIEKSQSPSNVPLV